MQTILGTNGQIAIELAKELKRNYTSDIKLVSRDPRRVNDTDTLFQANLLNAEKTAEAVRGSDIAYLTVGLPFDTKLWMEQFPVIMRNTIDACIKHNTKLVFFDNTYMYPQNSIPLTENSPFEPVGPRGKVRAEIATMLLNEMEAKRIEAVICRAPEFYGPDKTKSLTNTLIFENIKKRKPCKVLLRDDTLRTLIWTPDAGKATALIGNSPDTYNQTWHLPCDDNRLTYKQMVDLASAICGDEIVYSILGKFTLKIGGLFSKEIREIQELLPRYSQDNIFVSDKFKKRFPEFEVTTYRDGFEILLSNNQ